MTAIALPRAVAHPARLRNGYRFELVKLLAQWRIRLLLVACLLGPAGFVAVVSQQSSLPVDTVFGRWMSQSGWAGPLVVLSFCCSWVLPLLTSLVAGDVFATEDRLGTWRHLLVAVRSPRRIFAAKSLASLTVILALVVGLAASGIVGGLLAVGNRALVGLDGHLIAPGDAARAVVLAWLCVLAPTLAFAAVGLLGSVLLGRSPMGLVTPALLAVLLQLAQLLPLPVVVRVALPSYGFLAWRGLFTDPAQLTPLVVGIVASLAWAVAATALAYLLFIRRDFTDVANDGAGRRALVVAVLPLAAVFAVTVGSGGGRDTGVGLGRRAGQAGQLTRDVLRPSLPPAVPRAAPSGRDRGPVGRQRGLRQGRLPGRGQGPGERLAVCRDLAHPRCHGHRLGHLPTRRHPGRALRRRR